MDRQGGRATHRGRAYPCAEIAVISRNHDRLESIVPFFHAAKVPVAYEREENVLDIQEVSQLITMARFVDSLMRRTEDADDLLPEILSFPFWDLARTDVWQIATTAKGTRPWLLVMKEAGGKMADIANFFIELGGSATYQTAEEVLHELIGGPQILAADDENDDDSFSPPSMGFAHPLVRSEEINGGPFILLSLPTVKGGARGGS